MSHCQISHEAAGSIVVGPIEASRSFPLRQAVLRPHQRVDEMDLPGSGHPDAIVIGATLEPSGEVVSTAAVSPEVPSASFDAVLPPGRRWRLRSMATADAYRSTGIGRAVLDAIIEHVSSSGGGALWCSARVPALAFYERAGFVSFGEAYETPDIGPHQLMWRVVEPKEEPRHG